LPVIQKPRSGAAIQSGQNANPDRRSVTGATDRNRRSAASDPDGGQWITVLAISDRPPPIRPDTGAASGQIMATVPIQTASDPARQFQTASDPGSYSGFLNNSTAATRIIDPDRQPVTGQIKAKTPGKPPIRSPVRSWRQYPDHRPPARQSAITQP